MYIYIYTHTKGKRNADQNRPVCAKIFMGFWTDWILMSSMMDSRLSMVGSLKEFYTKSIIFVLINKLCTWTFNFIRVPFLICWLLDTDIWSSPRKWKTKRGRKITIWCKKRSGRFKLWYIYIYIYTAGKYLSWSDSSAAEILLFHSTVGQEK